MMRVIIEVDNEHELERVLDALKTEVFRDQPIQVTTPRRAPSHRERQAILQKLFDTYRITLPVNWKFDRDEAHER